MAGRAAQDEGTSTDEITVMIGGRAPRDDRWPADAASRIEAAAAALELCDTTEFETVLLSSLAEIADLFGVAALGECTGVPGEGVTWLDETSTSIDELVAMIGDLERSASAADGPYSVVAPSGRPAIGVVALPSLGQVFWGICLPGRERSGVEGGDVHMLPGDSTGPDAIRIVCSRSHTPDWMQRFAEAIGPHELVPIGSVGFKSSRILIGDADVYVHKTGLKEWDTCAPEGLARSQGWFVSRVDGSEQLYNQADPYNDELVICRPAIKDKVLAALQRAVAE